MKIFHKLILVLLISPGLAQAVEIDWNNPSGGLFNTPGNWLGAVPMFFDDANFDLSAGSPYTVAFTSDVDNRILIVRNDDLIFDLGGNTYTLSANSLIGRDSGNIGKLRITNGTLANAGGIIGNSNGSTGVVTVAGAGSQWSSPGGLTVGQFGNGTLNIEAGGVVTNSFTGISGSNTSTSAVTVTGAGSQLNLSNGVFVGGSGNGTLNIEAGGVVSSTSAIISNGGGSTSVATVTGAGSQWNNSDSLIVGHSGDGTLNIEAGGVVTNTAGRISSFPNSTSAVTVTGAGAQWNNSLSLIVGREGDATLNIEAGGVVTNADGHIGIFPSSTSEVTVTGAGSEWNNSELYIGQGPTTTPRGVGILNIGPGGTVNVTGETRAGTSDVINLDGGTLKTATFRAGGTSLFNWTAGTLHLTGAVGASSSSTMSFAQFNQPADVVFQQDVIAGAGYDDLVPDLVGSLSGAKFLAGQNSGVTEIVSQQWTEASTGGQFGSDILNITGMQLDGGAAGQTDPFALQMNYDLSSLGFTEADLILSGDLAMFWDDGANWVNAVDGNFANNATGGQLGFAGSFADFQTANGTVLGDYIGAWGYDTANASVWSVLDHNSSFAAVVLVPEPSTHAMLLLAGMVGLSCWRRKQSSDLLGGK